MAKNNKVKGNTFINALNSKEVPNTPVQVVTDVKVIENIKFRDIIDNLSKEPYVNFTTSFPLPLRDKLKAKAIKENRTVKDLLIEALIYKFDDLA